MDIVYHGSKEHGLKRLVPKKSTHGVYVYGTYDYVLSMHFGKRCGDDLTYDIGHFDSNDIWELVENIPMGLEKMYSNSSSIYTVSSSTFKDINTGFYEVVSEDVVDVLNEEYYDNLYEAILKLEKDGLLKIYRYPNKPINFNKNHIFDKWRYYKYKLNKDFKKYEFDRLVYLHPYLLNEVNRLAKEFNYDYHYEISDLYDIFKERVERQIIDPTHEEYIDSAYINICNTYPNLKNMLDEIYDNYKKSNNRVI